MFEMSGSGQGESSSRARIWTGFGKIYKPTADEWFSQIKTSLFNQTTKPNTALFGSTTVASLFGESGQATTAHPNFGEFKFGKTSGSDEFYFAEPLALPVLSQTKTSLFNQTIQPNTALFGSTTVASLFGESGQATTAHPNFGEFKFGKTSGSDEFYFAEPLAFPVLSQTKTSLFNQTTQPNTALFGSTTVAPVFGESGQATTAHPNFEEFKFKNTSGSGEFYFAEPLALAPMLSQTKTSLNHQTTQPNTALFGTTAAAPVISSNTSFQQSKPVETPIEDCFTNSKVGQQDKPQTAAQVYRLSIYQLLQNPVWLAIYTRGWENHMADIQRRLRPLWPTQHGPPRPTLGRHLSCWVKGGSRVKTEAQKAKSKRMYQNQKWRAKWKARRLTKSQRYWVAKKPEPTSEPEVASKSPSQPTPPVVMEVDPTTTKGEKKELVPSISQAVGTDTVSKDAWLEALGPSGRASDMSLVSQQTTSRPSFLLDIPPRCRKLSTNTDVHNPDRRLTVSDDLWYVQSTIS